MTIEIDIKALSKEDQKKILLEILKENSELYEEVKSIIPNEKEEVSMDYIDKIVSQDFERYDEVFRKLA